MWVKIEDSSIHLLLYKKLASITVCDFRSLIMSDDQKVQISQTYVEETKATC